MKNFLVVLITIILIVNSFILSVSASEAKIYMNDSFLPGETPSVETALKTVIFADDGSSAIITAMGDTVTGIYINGSFYPGKEVTYMIPSYTRYLTIQVEDASGYKTDPIKKRVPGWSQITDRISILPVKFSQNNTVATITATSDDDIEIKGVYVDGELQKGNPITYTIPKASKYLQLQAVDIEGDKSNLYDVRVPGWTDIRQDIRISSAEFSDDNTLIMVKATESAGYGVAGIYINDEFYKGNPVLAIVNEGEKHLKLQAENGEGDRSPVVTKRVPGWSEIVDTLKIASVEWTAQNTIATIMGQDSKGKSVTGIYVNDTLYEGNPVIYQVPDNLKTLKLQAVNIDGDLSAIVNQPVPEDESSASSEPENKSSDIKISIKEPDWTNERSAKVKVSVSAHNDIEISEIWATTDEGDWEDITSSKSITVKEDTTVTVLAIDANGVEKEVSKDIQCFDLDPPSINAAQNGDIVTVRADDNKSGVEKVIIAGNMYSGHDAKNIQFKLKDTSASDIQIEAYDYAGNVKTSIFSLKVKEEDNNASIPSRSLPETTVVTPTIADTYNEDDDMELSGEPLEEISAIPENGLIALEPESSEAEPESSSQMESEPEPVIVEVEDETHKLNIVPIIGLLALVIGLGVGAWFFINRRSQPNEAMFFDDEDDENDDADDANDMETEPTEELDVDKNGENL